MQNIDNKPTKPGSYCIYIEDIWSFVAMFADFDGENWNLTDYQDFIKEGRKIYWFDDGLAKELK